MKRAKLLLLSLLVCGAQVLAAADSEKDTTDSETDTESVASEPIGLPKKVKKALAVDSISAVVYAADGKKQSSKDGKLGDKLFNSVQLNAQQSVEVSFIPQLSGSAAKPQQAMLMASSKVHPRLAAYAIAKVKKDGSHVVTLGTTSIEKQLGTVGGEFELSLLLGDPAAHIGLSGALGTIVLPETASGAAPKLKLLTAAHQPISNFKPNIAHTFRAPDKRAPAIVSLTFTGLALAPLGLLVIHLTSLGVNLKVIGDHVEVQECICVV
eukprot:GHRR01028901.1.p1 GENE.GHRR01028901.1~~GHRR01028901.1.p1  ORF type:complete len:267 (+),score=87.20 GHRR01028901.1:175-975(+)